MKKTLIGFLILGGVLLAIFLIIQISRPQQQQPVSIDTQADGEAIVFPEPPPGAIVFDMKYCGLSGEKDELRYNSYWGFGGGANDTPFLADLKKDVKNFETVYNPNFKGAEWSAVEIKDNKAVALYVDLDTDGKVSENEKILPIQNPESGSFNQREFVTPDFIVKTRENRQVPFRALLQVDFYGQPPRPNCMWSPSCVLEGTSTMNGRPAKMILFTSGFSGSFKDFGRSSISLQAGKEKTGSYISKQTLSSIINHEGQFYNVAFNGRHGKNSTVRAILTKYTGDTGNLTTQLTGNTNLQAELSRARVSGSKDTNIRFNFGSEQAKLPTGSYKLNSGNVNYSTENGDKWRVDFKEGPEFTIDADKTCKVELGKPVLSISAVDEKKRYQSDVKEQTVYSEGTEIYISRIIKGKEGELYGRFSQKQEDSRRYLDIQPDLKIIDSEGKEVAAAKIKYG
ncbi:MAG: hypothetical protein ACYSUX_12800 [Planctomycetota bacterium]|jgi:hypothetical protein